MSRRVVNWKSRYAELFDQQDKQQLRYKKKQALLSTALSDAVTLLHVLKKFLSGDPTMVMALREDTAVPF